MGHYDPSALPFLAEIMDACSDPETSEVGDMGPAQGGKSLVGEAFMGWSIEHDPADFLMCQPDKALAQDFVVRRINPLVSGTPALKAQLLPAANADNIFLKQFRGMLLTTIWPVASQFRARPIPRGWLDDFDQIPADVEGQGSAIQLLSARQTTFEGRDTKLVSSSPAREDGSGIEAFVEGGTDERLQPVCPHCLDRIELDIRRDLKFEKGSLEVAEQSAHVVCPANGCVMLPSDRRRLLDSCRDLPHRGFVARRPEAGKRRRTFRRDGLLAFTSWSNLAREWREAQIAWELRQDEGPLRAFFNTKGGQNYRSHLTGEKPVEADALKKRREKGWRLGTVPRGPVVLNLLIDVQHDRFEYGVIGYGKDGERWLVDRRSIDALGDGLTQVAPLTHAEHWKVLLPLFDKKYPLAELGEDGKPVGYAPILSITVDTGGSDRAGDQATAGAKWFWNAARALGVHPSRITLVKGGSQPKSSKLMPPAQFADQRAKGGAKRNGAKLWLPNVHGIKNILDAKLRRPVPGPGYVHLPENLDDDHVEEITAEVLQAGKWVKRRARNETLDILVYGEAAILKPPFAQSRTDMRWVPKAFRIVWPAAAKIEITDPAAAPLDSTNDAPPPEPAEGQAENSRKPATRRASKFTKRSGSWVNRRR